MRTVGLHFDKVDRYRVIKDIPEGWETGAKVGEILTVQHWNSFLTLMKDGEAVCDLESDYQKECCEKITD